MQPCLRTYWLRDCSHAVAWELNWSAVSSVLNIGCPQHPKNWPGHIQNACRHAAHFLPHRPGIKIKGTRLAKRAALQWVAQSPQGSRGAAFLNMKAFGQESVLLGACSQSEKPSRHQSENPKVKFQALGTDCLLFIWNTSQRFLCWLSSASENFHSDLLRKTWPKKKSGNFCFLLLTFKFRE